MNVVTNKTGKKWLKQRVEKMPGLSILCSEKNIERL